MGKIQVEVCYQDGELKSILVDTRPMRIPSMIKTAPVAAWFEPASTDRVSWDGLGTEIRDKSNSGDENVEYSFLFQGPEKEKQEFLDKVEEYLRRRPSKTPKRSLRWPAGITTAMAWKRTKRKQPNGTAKLGRMAVWKHSWK